jgi:hypothetical protein
VKSEPNRFIAVRSIRLAALSLCLASGVFAAALTWDSDTGASGAQDSSGTWTAVPEPTSALAGLLITAGLLPAAAARMSAEHRPCDPHRDFPASRC